MELKDAYPKIRAAFIDWAENHWHAGVVEPEIEPGKGDNLIVLKAMFQPPTGGPAIPFGETISADNEDNDPATIADDIEHFLGPKLALARAAAASQPPLEPGV
jgi:hypothetical protein